MQILKSDFVFFSYLGYRKDNRIDNINSVQELLMSMICFAQFVLLGTFAAILGAHRSEIIEKSEVDEAYETPYAAAD